MFKKNSEDEQKIKKENERIRDIRIHLSHMEEGKRILLRDGVTGIFKGFNGNLFEGELFSIKINGILQEIPVAEYDCLLIDNSDVTCPMCKGVHIMDGYIGNTDGTLTLFRENINKSTAPSFNSRAIYTNACRNCGYAMLYINLKNKG